MNKRLRPRLSYSLVSYHNVDVFTEKFLDDCNYNDYNIWFVRLKLIGVYGVTEFFISGLD